MDALEVELSTGRRPRGPGQVPAVPDPGRGEDPPCLTQLADWLDDRTGYRRLVHEALEEPIPGGARWRYVFGSALSTTFLIQLVDRPAADARLQPVVVDGLGERLLHQQPDDAGLVHPGHPPLRLAGDGRPAGVHLLQVLWAGAYRAPREVNWWFGMALLFLTLGFSLTGYLLPWDQKGYWATKVATNIAGGAPVLGPSIQKVVVGGPDYGNQTLTRFYGLHVGVLPALFVLCLAAHVALFRRHGLTPPRNAAKSATGTFWPEQVFMDTVASVAVFGVLVCLVLSEGGANLDAPADPSSATTRRGPSGTSSRSSRCSSTSPATARSSARSSSRPRSWWCCSCSRSSTGSCPRRLAHFLACCFVFALVGGGGLPDRRGVAADAANAELPGRPRARPTRPGSGRSSWPATATSASPPTARRTSCSATRSTHGRAVLEKKCLGCHYYDGKGQSGDQGQVEPQSPPTSRTSAPTPGSAACSRTRRRPPTSARSRSATAWSSGRRARSSRQASSTTWPTSSPSFAEIPADMTPEEWLNSPGVADHPGLEPFRRSAARATSCEGLSEGGTRDDAPKLFAWGSPQWIARMIHKPGAPDLYGYLEKKDQMPAFADAVDRERRPDARPLPQERLLRRQPDPAEPGGRPKSPSRSPPEARAGRRARRR